jgi:hypothetical protein
MKPRKVLSFLVCLITVHFSTTPLRADQVISSFDTDTGGWAWENWSADSSLVFDPFDDAGADPSSGAMQLTANFGASADYQQSVFTMQLPAPAPLTNFAKISLDVMVDGGSALRTGDTDAGHFEIIMRTGPSWTWTSISFDALQIGGWTHLEGNIPTLASPDDMLSAITLKIGDGDFTGPVIVYVDNVKLVSRPDPVTVLAGFNDETEALGWYWEDWSAPGTPEFDLANDADGSDLSGSLRLTASFEQMDGYQQSVFSYQLLTPIDGVTYGKIGLDVKVDPDYSTPRTGQSDYGTFEIIVRNGPNWDWNSLTNVSLTSTNWTHVEANFVPPDDAVHHLTLKLGQNGFAGPVTFNVDNIVLLENTNKTIVPPTMSIEKTMPGLNLIASQLQGQYQRQEIYTTGSSYSWVGKTEPVSYSFELSHFPDSTYSGFQAHIFLLPTDFAPGNPDVDWSEPNLIFFDVSGQADGSAIATFRYKTNSPAGNTMTFNSDPTKGAAGTLGSVTNATPLGKWTITFTGDTHVTITAPDGTTNAMDIPADVAALFNGPVIAYFGDQPNQLANIGQSVVIKRIDITGTDIPISETFSDETLNPDNWTVVAADPKGVQLRTSQTPWAVSWTGSTPGFTLQTAAVLDTNSWSDLSITGTPIGSTLQTLINATNLPAGNTAFFRLIKR